MIGAGKYDQCLTDVRIRTKAAGALLIIIGGECGDGFSAQIPPWMLSGIPAGLRSLADQIEADARKLSLQ